MRAGRRKPARFLTMFYDFTVTVPHNTSQENPVEQICPVTAGAVHRVSVQFPRGTYARVHIQIRYHEFQVWPTNPDGSLNADGYPLEWDESYPIDTDPFEFKVIAWSTADTYDYDINIRFGILRTEDVEKQSGIMVALSKFLKLVGLGG